MGKCLFCLKGQIFFKRFKVGGVLIVKAMAGDSKGGEYRRMGG